MITAVRIVYLALLLSVSSFLAGAEDFTNAVRASAEGFSTVNNDFSPRNPFGGRITLCVDRFFVALGAAVRHADTPNHLSTATPSRQLH